MCIRDRLMPVKSLRKTRFSYPGYEGEIDWAADGRIRGIKITTAGSGYTTEPAVSLLSSPSRRALVSSDLVQYYRANPVLAAMIDGRPILNG